MQIRGADGAGAFRQKIATKCDGRQPALAGALSSEWALISASTMSE